MLGAGIGKGVCAHERLTVRREHTHPLAHSPVIHVKWRERERHLAYPGRNSVSWESPSAGVVSGLRARGGLQVSCSTGWSTGRARCDKKPQWDSAKNSK